MEIRYLTGSYFASSTKSDAPGAAKISAPREDKHEGIAPGIDRVDISQEGRSRQQSSLMRRLDGEEPDQGGRIAYGPAANPEAAQGSGDDDDTAQRIRELQAQLKAAMNRLQQARQELSEAQAKNISEVKAAQNGESPAASGSVEQQQAAQEQKAAQQKVVSAQAEVNTIQEQLQKYLQKQAQSAAG